MNYFLEIIIAIIANVISYCICEWLNSYFRK